MLPPQQHLSPAAAFTSVQGQMQPPMPNMGPNMAAFQMPPQLQQQQQQQQQPTAAHLNLPTQASTHRRNQSAMPNVSMGPPPAPSSGAAGSGLGELASTAAASYRENDPPRGGRGGGHGGSSGGGHQRRHSLALPEAKKAAEVAQQKRTTSAFQFPIPHAGKATSSSAQADSATAEGHDKVSSGLAPNIGRGGHRGGVSGAHHRSQSAAIGSNGRGGPTHGRSPSAFQFPAAGSSHEGAASGHTPDVQRRGSQGHHGRNASRNFEGNWRQQGGHQSSLGHEQPNPMGQFNQSPNPNLNGFQPGHRVRASMGQSIGSIGAFQYQTQPQIIQLPSGQMILQQQAPPLFPGQQLSPLQMQQLQALQAAQLGGQQMMGIGGQGPHGQPQLAAQQQQQQPQQPQQQQPQRKTLFTPYLPQASLPALLNDGQLVAGILRVNKKNRSDAYVSTQDGLLDADIFICGSKDRNRALEGDLVAVELLDVDDVWSQKREKEEKKKRKDINDSRAGGSTTTTTTTTGSDRPTASEGDVSGSRSKSIEGGIRRRGSLRQRPTQKKNDDVEVEGQSLLLMEEEEVNDEQKPLYAGHVVAVIERVAGQMFSG